MNRKEANMFSYRTNDLNSGIAAHKTFVAFHRACISNRIKIFLTHGWIPSTVAHPKTHHINILHDYEGFLEEASFDYALGLIVNEAEAEKVSEALDIFAKALVKFPTYPNDLFINITRTFYILSCLLISKA